MKFLVPQNFRFFLEKRFGYSDCKILSSGDGNNLIAQLLNSNEPVAIGKIGAVETSAIQNFLLHRGKKVSWKSGLSEALYINAGIFPKNAQVFNAFCTEFVESLKKFNLLAVWFCSGESKIIKTYACNAKLAELCCLEPYYHKEPWSKYLAGKKVLVIHPFIESIKQQYQLRSKLWQDNNCLPDFELDTIKAPLSDVLLKSEFCSWFEALEYMKKEMSKKEFDVAIVGAGAYSVPLVAHAKEMGKFGIHMGGATQIIFGIKGRRWDNHEIGLKFYNDYWVRPSKKETPENVDAIEQGCYW